MKCILPGCESEAEPDSLYCINCLDKYACVGGTGCTADLCLYCGDECIDEDAQFEARHAR